MAKIDQISMFTVRVQVIISNRNWCFFATNKTEKGGTEFLDLVQMSAIRIVRHTKIRGMANPYDIRWQSYFSKRSWGTYMVLSDIIAHELTATIIEKFHGLIDGVENDPVMSYTYINFFLDMICEFNYRYKCQSTDLNKYVFYNQYFLGRGYPIMGRKPVRDERRKQILDAVHQCLLEKPFHKTSIKDIARKAGLNHGALHYYFENKEHILLEYIDYTKKQFDIVYNDFLKEAYVRPTSDLDSINEKCRWTLNELSFHKEYAKIFIEIWAHALYNPNVMKKIKDMYREWRDQFSSDISNIVDSKKEARKISLTMIAVFEGLSLMSSLFAKKDLQYDFDFNGFLKLLNTK